MQNPIGQTNDISMPDISKTNVYIFSEIDDDY